MSFINTIDLLGDEYTLTLLLDGTLSEYNDDSLTETKAYSFYGSTVKKICLPNVLKVSGDSFAESKVEILDFHSVNELYASCVSYCNSMKALIIRSSTKCTCKNSFGSSALKNGTAYVYVPSSLVESYKTSSYWNALQFRALEDYTVDGTITGELDLTKI